MSDKTLPVRKQAALRSKAVSRLNGLSTEEVESQRAPAAYDVLHKLASSPTTAGDALALLHELQVHQIELELQAEEMRDAYANLEAALQRQHQLYEAAPVGYFTVNSETALVDLNAAGAKLLERQREALLGQYLYSFLWPDSSHHLQARIRRVAAGQPVGTCDLLLATPDGGSETVHVSINPDPDGIHFLVVFMLASPLHPVATGPSTP